MIFFPEADGDDNDVKFRSREAKGISCLKAKVIGYIPLEMAAIFFLANLYLRQGIG